MRSRLRFLTRRNCTLCDAALPRVQRAAGWLRLDIEVVDVDSAGLADEYGERIPVLLGTDDRVVAEAPLRRFWWTLLRFRVGAEH